MLTKTIDLIARLFGKKIIIQDRFTKSPYLIRYILFSSKYFSIYIHRFLCSDAGFHHDHPWNFFTWVITKGYVEEKLVQDMTTSRGTYVETEEKRLPNTIAYRKAEDLHRVKIDRTYSVEEEKLAPLTVCFIGKRRRVWGFANVDKFNISEKDTLVWQNWIDYLNLNEKEVQEAMKGRAV